MSGLGLSLELNPSLRSPPLQIESQCLTGAESRDVRCQGVGFGVETAVNIQVSSVFVVCILKYTQLSMYFGPSLCDEF